MKKYLFFILLIISAGCRVINLPAGKSEPVPAAASPAMDVYTPTDSIVPDSLLPETDSLLPTTDSLPAPPVRPEISADSALLKTDSVPALPDSLHTAKTVSLPADTTVKKGSLEAAVEYQSRDSIIWMAGDNMAYFFGEGNVKYLSIELNSDFIRMDMDSSLLYATNTVDSLGEETGFPVFKDGEQMVESHEMRYNFKTGKGLGVNSVTRQGEGFVIANVTKKMPNNVLNMEGGRYTACDAPEPHFYFNMTKAKVRPGKDIVTGPVWLVVEDVPLFPLVLPFAYFPFTDHYSSGIIMPSYGDEMARGFFLRNGGYYLALSDYYDLALTGELYTKGSWGLSGKSSYRKRYKYSGNVDLSYLVTVTGDEGLPDYSKANDFKIRWSHSQDAAANPYRTISANVDYSSSSYDRRQLNSIYTQAATQNNKGSSVSLTQRFPNKPFSLSATMNINQRSQDSSISVTLPDLTFTFSRIYPLKRKNPIGKERWYEKISMSYTGYLRNNIQTKEDLLFKSSLLKDWKNGMQHTIPISATYTMFSYINVSPSFNYTERWYTHKILQDYDYTQKRMAPSDTVYGFYRLFNYSASVSASTTVYGMFTPWKPFRKLVKMIRHRMDPSISYSMTPDFGDPKYGYYYNHVVLDNSNTPLLGANPYKGTSYTYSPFDGQIFGIPGRGKSGSVSLSIDNNLEAKIPSSSDSTGEKKISLIDKFSGSMSYNLAADSFQWSDLSTAVRIKFGKFYTMNLNLVWDTYTYEYNETTRQPRRVNKTRWEAGKGLGRLRSTGTSFSYTFNNETIKKLLGGGEKDDRKTKQQERNGLQDDGNYDPNNPLLPEDMNSEHPGEERDRGSLLNKKKKIEGDYDEDGYYVNPIQWSLSFSWSMSLAYGAFNPEKMEYDYKINNALSFNGNLQPTKNWRINFNATYDWDNRKISYMTCNISRTMHCFQMSASLIPIGPLKSYSFSISASASMLKDLKYDQRSSVYNRQNWY